MDDLRETILSLSQSLLPGDDYFVVDAAVSGGKNARKVTVLIDSDKGLDIDACAMISRQLSEKIDEMDLIKSKYILEVSSPGLDQPLKLPRQYRKNIGRKIKVGLADKKTIEGQLITVNNDHICIKVANNKKETKEIAVPFDQIAKTQVLVSFK